MKLTAFDIIDKFHEDQQKNMLRRVLRTRRRCYCVMLNMTIHYFPRNKLRDYLKAKFPDVSNKRREDKRRD